MAEWIRSHFDKNLQVKLLQLNSLIKRTSGWALYSFHMVIFQLNSSIAFKIWYFISWDRIYLIDKVVYVKYNKNSVECVVNNFYICASEKVENLSYSFTFIFFRFSFNKNIYFNYTEKFVTSVDKIIIRTFILSCNENWKILPPHGVNFIIDDGCSSLQRYRWLSLTWCSKVWGSDIFRPGSNWQWVLFYFTSRCVVAILRADNKWFYFSI